MLLGSAAAAAHLANISAAHDATTDEPKGPRIGV